MYGIRNTRQCSHYLVDKLCYYYYYYKYYEYLRMITGSMRNAYSWLLIISIYNSGCNHVLLLQSPLLSVGISLYIYIHRWNSKPHHNPTINTLQRWTYIMCISLLPFLLYLCDSLTSLDHLMILYLYHFLFRESERERTSDCVQRSRIK